MPVNRQTLCHFLTIPEAFHWLEDIMHAHVHNRRFAKLGDPEALKAYWEMAAGSHSEAFDTTVVIDDHLYKLGCNIG